MGKRLTRKIMSKEIFIFLISIGFSQNPGCYNNDDNEYSESYTEEGCISWDEQTYYPEMQGNYHKNYCR